MSTTSLSSIVCLATAALVGCGSGLTQTVAFESGSASAGEDGPRIVERLERLDLGATLRPRTPSAFAVEVKPGGDAVLPPVWLDAVSRPGRVRVLEVVSGMHPHDGPTAVFATREEAEAAAYAAAIAYTTTTPAFGGRPAKTTHALLQVGDTPLVDAVDVVGAALDEDDQGRAIVRVRLSEAARERVASWTEAHIGRFVAIVLDDEVVSVPVIGGRDDRGELSLVPPEYDDDWTAGASATARQRAQGWWAALGGPTLRGTWTWKIEAPASAL